MDKHGNRLEFLKKMLKEEPDDPFLNYALGLEYLKNSHNTILAEIQFRKVTEHDPEYMAAFYQLGKLLQDQTKITEALHYYRLGLEIAEKKKEPKAIAEFLEAIFLLED
ncbi:MAG TPA: tetratricopeptide repeat protein [Bacteroidia bacterium]|nr:tetratricopeptide repeat protein [Bacteroidia bacterium]